MHNWRWIPCQHINTDYFILPNNDFTDFVYELRGQPSYLFDIANFKLFFDKKCQGNSIKKKNFFFFSFIALDKHPFHIAEYIIIYK